MNLRLSLALLLIFLCANIKQTYSGGCFCYNGAGTYCGFHRENGLIAGDCSKFNQYICPADVKHGGLAHHNGGCFNDSCVSSVPPGRDFCDPEGKFTAGIRNDGKSLNTSTEIMRCKEAIKNEIYMYTTFSLLLVICLSLPVIVIYIVKIRKKMLAISASFNLNDKLHDQLYDMPRY